MAAALLLLLLRRRLPLVVNAAAFGTGNRLGNVAHVLLQAGHRRCAEVGTGNRNVHVEVGVGARNLFGVLLGKFGRADQAFLFRIPTGKDAGCAWDAIPIFSNCSDAMHRLKLRRGSAVGIDRTINPGIAMVAGNHPLVGKLRSANHADHVPDGHELIVLLERPYGLSPARVRRDK